MAAEPDPFGRALRDHYHDRRDGPLLTRDGERTRDHPIEAFYFGDHQPDEWRDGWLDGPVVDLGAGAGRDALALQERFETVALEASDHLVELMRERGVQNARRGDMFALRDAFGRDRFRSALAVGTQLGLAGSMDGLRRFLADLAFVTTPDGTAVLDCYDPEHEATSDLLGYRPDHSIGLAFRLLQFEYEGELGTPLLFRLFGPDRVREATVGTDWRVAAVRHDQDGPRYWVALAKR